jgi:cell division protein FtsQ
VLLDERTERRLRRIRWRRVGIAAGLVAAVAGLIALYFSPALRVQRVEVVGTSVVDPAQVEQLASFGGDSMFRLDTEGAIGRIGYLPMVESVEIARRWPQTVRITVTERVAWGYWQSGETLYPIDAGGIVLEGVQPPEGAPLIKNIGPPSRLVAGDHTDADAAALTRALLEQVPARLSLNIAALEYSPDAGLAVVTDAGYRVVIGDSQNMDYKLTLWQTIEGRLGREAMAGHVLDLRFRDRPSFQ